MRITCNFNGDKKFIVLGDVVEKMLSYRQFHSKQKESGGLLIGRHLIENDNIVVDNITEPNKWDKRLFTYFFRSKHHNRVVYKKWQQSKKTQTLVGLWHTHPEPIPRPSHVDMNDWKNVLLQGAFVGNSLFFLIVGTAQINIWQGNKSTQFTKLSTHISHKRTNND